MLVSTNSISTNISTPMKLNSNLGKQALSSSKKIHIINHIDNSMEPSVSSSTIVQEFPLKIGIIGLGEFGQFLAQAFKRQGHNVLGTSRSDYTQFCHENGIEFFRNVNALCEAEPDVLLVCSSIVSTESVVRGIPFHKLKPDTIIVDVLSVKQFPKNLLLDVVPSEFGILCTHPMFGKFSGKNRWEGLRFVYEQVRIAENTVQQRKCEQFLNIFQDETKNTASHSSELYEGLFLFNTNTTKQIEKLDKAFDTVKQNLFGKLRATIRKQMEVSVSIEKTKEAAAAAQPSHFLPINEDVKDLSSFSFIPPKKGNQDTKVNNGVHHATLL
ncbi:Arogenate dehydrogenase 2 protein [Thalictrum thalictroides]|uniref:Arogenate dehydrogenase 2 protein n=1 Tax=Thalictrum thalictroides TaxID=46969 RepID=A0A7J6WQA0_THATH|nr:Arogenate dehydrogenase 2 protein [Thalictrum thalictroides]